MRETHVLSLGQEDPLEKEMAAHFSVLAWRIPRREEPGGLQFMGSQRVGHDLATKQTSNVLSFLHLSPTAPLSNHLHPLLILRSFLVGVVCACAQLLLSCLTLCDPMDHSLPGSFVHGIFPGKNTRVGCHFLL